jgi:hypothetical protein
MSQKKMVMLVNFMCILPQLIKRKKENLRVILHVFAVFHHNCKMTATVQASCRRSTMSREEEERPFSCLLRELGEIFPRRSLETLPLSSYWPDWLSCCKGAWRSKYLALCSLCKE